MLKYEQNDERPMPEKLKGRREKKEEYARPVGISLYESDRQLLEWTAHFLGTSRSDAVRTAIRAYSASLAYMEMGVDGGEVSRSGS